MNTDWNRYAEQKSVLELFSGTIQQKHKTLEQNLERALWQLQ